LGEGQFIEFKEVFGKEVIETLVAFSNSFGGGKVLIGVKRVREKLKDYGLADLKISEIQSGFNIEVFSTKLNGGLNELLGLIKKNSGIQLKELSNILGRPIDTLDKQVKKLVDADKIGRKESKKTGGYWIIKNE